MTVVLSAFPRHLWTSDNGSLIFNDGDFHDPASWPFYLLDYPIKGLRRLPDLDDNTEPNTEANGVRELDSYARSKLVTYAGKLYGRDQLEMLAGIDALLLAFGPDPVTGLVLPPGRMVIEAPASVAGGIDQTFTAVCRVAECNEDYPGSGAAGNEENEQPTPYHASFSLDLRLADARFYDWDGVSATNGKW